LSSTNEPLDGIVAAYFDLAQMYFLGNQINFVPASQENLSYPESIAADDFHVINPSAEDLQQAIRYYTQTIELQPNPYTETGIVFHNRAFAECMMQEWDDCLSDFLEFYRRIHSDETESRNLASAYMIRSVFRTYDDADDYDGAIDDLNKAVELGVEPSCNGTYVQYYDAYVGRINNELDDQDHDGLINLSQLIEDYGKIIDLEPKECQNASIARIYLARGKAYMMIGENELATQDLRMYLQLLPEAENQAEVEELIKSMK
jgi:tetratricopeptide (TPR) repeat protein